MKKFLYMLRATLDYILLVLGIKIKILWLWQLMFSATCCVLR